MRRTAIVIGVFAVAVHVVSPAFALSSRIMIQDTNLTRKASNLSTLHRSTTLDTAAVAKAKSMFAEQFFGHTSPTGKPFYAWLGSGRVKFTRLGENIASGYRTEQSLMNAWMASGGHRQNLLDTRYTHVGIGIRSGMLLGKRTTVVVELFGTKKPSTPLISTPVSVASVGVSQ